MAGTGGSLEVQVAATYDVQLTVFQGRDCAEQICIDGTEGYTTDVFKGSIVWESDEQASYKILVHGFSGSTGDFELFFSEVIRPPNDECEGATGLELFDLVAGSTKFAAEDEVAFCGKLPDVLNA